MKEYIIPSKYMYATKFGKQFITSFGDEYTKRKKDGHVFISQDGLWCRSLLEGLKYNEKGVEINLIITLKRRPHTHKMWMFGKKYHRQLFEYRPTLKTIEGWFYKGGNVWLDFWTSKEYFPDLDDQQPIEVYVSAKRVQL